MLPILRILPVGGVLLAISILLLALMPPGDPHRRLTQTALQARGPLIDRAAHPEWRQFLSQAALRRADALNWLRDLPDTPGLQMRGAPDTPATTEIVIPLPAVEDEHAPAEPAPEINAEDAPQRLVSLPEDRLGTDPQDEDVTGSINELPGATIPVDIGETSSTELPVAMPEEAPPAIRVPQRGVPERDSRRKAVHHTRHAKSKKPRKAKPASKSVSKSTSKSASKRARRVTPKIAPKIAPKPRPPAEVNVFDLLFGLDIRQQPGLVDMRGAEPALPASLLRARSD